MATDNIATLGIKVDPKGAVSGANRAKKAIRGIGNVAGKVKSQIFSLNGALGVLGVGMVAKSALNYASSIESLRVQLKYLTGDTRSAGKAFDYMLKFAKSAPFSLQQIQKASPSLLTVADDVDELNSLMEITGDIASSSVLDFQQVAQQLQKTFSGGISAADQFRDSGVKALLGFETGVKYTAEASKKHIMKLWSESTTSMKGATKDMAQTFEGQVSMMGDAWDELQLAFMKEGVFDETKTSVEEITEWLRSPEVVQGAKDIGNGVREIATGIKNAVQEYNDLPEWVKNSGLVLAVFGGKAGKVGMIAMIGYANELKAILQEVGVIDYSPKQITDAIKQVEDRIEAVKEKMGGQELSWWQEALFAGNPLIADQNMLDSLEERLDELRSQYSSLPIGTRTGFETGVSTTPDGFENIDLGQPDPVMIDLIAKGEEDAAKALKNTLNLSSATNKYKESIINVGVEMTKRKKIEKAFEAEKTRIQAYVVQKSLSASVEAKAIGEVTDAYEKAIDRMDELDVAKRVQAIASSMESSITDMIMNIGNGANSLKDTVKDMARAILAEFIKIQVARPAANFLAGMTSNLFSFDGGGYTGSGSRSGGIDGRGGFQAILHPNETVVDHTKGQTSTSGETNVNVSFNITANDTTGFDDLLDSRRGMIVGIINQAMNDRGMTGVTA